MQRGWAATAVAVAILAVGARGQEGGRPREGFIGPVLPGGGAAQARPVAETPGQPRDGDTGGAPAPVLAAAVESRPLGAPPSRGTVSGFRDRHGDGAGGVSGAPPLRAGDGWWRTAGALAIILAVIFATAAGVRKWAGRSGGLVAALGAGGRAPSGLLYVLGRYPAGRGQTLVLLKLDRRVILVCQSGGMKGGGMRTLCELTDPEEVASVILQAGEAEGRTLGARFREMVSSFESSHADAEVVLRPVEVPSARGPDASPDAADRLHSRLDSMRRAGWGATA